jgi:predicted nucleic acid-binding protein
VATDYRRPYLDSGIFISWVKGQDIGLLADGSSGDRTPISEDVLKRAEGGEYPAITSYFTMAEVFKKKGDTNPPLTPEQNGKIMKYFENEWITWVTLERLVGEHANKLLVHYQNPDNRQEGAQLRPCDAIHLASALRAKCDVLLTWDGPFSKIEHPNIRIQFPERRERQVEIYSDLLGERHG